MQEENTEKAPEKKKPEQKAKEPEKAPEINVPEFLKSCGRDMLLCEKFRKVARQYGRTVKVNGNVVTHDIPHEQLKYMIALVK